MTHGSPKKKKPAMSSGRHPRAQPIPATQLTNWRVESLVRSRSLKPNLFPLHLNKIASKLAIHQLIYDNVSWLVGHTEIRCVPLFFIFLLVVIINSFIKVMQLLHHHMKHEFSSSALTRSNGLVGNPGDAA